MATVLEIVKTEAKTIVHKQCGAKIEYFQNEVVSKVEDEPYGGGKDTYHYLQCPNCKEMIRWC